MISRIEAQDVAAVVLLVGALCYAVAVAIFAATVLVARRRVAADPEATSPVMPMPLSAVVALITFLAARVVEHRSRELPCRAGGERDPRDRPAPGRAAGRCGKRGARWSRSSTPSR